LCWLQQRPLLVPVLTSPSNDSKPKFAQFWPIPDKKPMKDL
jgi:hypothetical protein